MLPQRCCQHRWWTQLWPPSPSWSQLELLSLSDMGRASFSQKSSLQPLSQNLVSKTNTGAHKPREPIGLLTCLKFGPSLNPGFMSSIPQFSILCRLENSKKMMFLVLVSGSVPWQTPFYTASFPAKEQIYEGEDYNRSCVSPMAQHHQCVILSSHCPLATSAAIGSHSASTHFPCLSALPQMSWG